MNQSLINNENLPTNEVFLKHYSSLLKHLKSKSLVIIIISIVGAVIGLSISYFKKVNYNAKISFIVEEGKTGNSGFSGIASQLGIDLNSISGNGGISVFSGDNILLFLKSKDLCRSTLRSKYGQSSSDYSLADKYAEIYGLRDKWESSSKVGSKIFFSANSNAKYTRLQDSLLQVITNRLLKNQLFVDRPEKKATFIDVTVKSVNDDFSKLFCERLVQNAIDKYIQIKIKRQKTNVERLEKRADSIANILYKKTYINAAEQERVLDINPGSRTAMVSSEISGRDKIILTTLFGEIVKNLELAKVSLNQDTPVIQIIDTPELPLPSDKISKLIYAVIGFFVAASIIIAVFIILFSIRFRMINQ